MTKGVCKFSLVVWGLLQALHPFAQWFEMSIIILYLMSLPLAHKSFISWVMGGP